jgi:hypothetical protein
MILFSLVIHYFLPFLEKRIKFNPIQIDHICIFGENTFWSLSVVLSDETKQNGVPPVLFRGMYLGGKPGPDPDPWSRAAPPHCVWSIITSAEKKTEWGPFIFMYEMEADLCESLIFLFLSSHLQQHMAKWTTQTIYSTAVVRSCLPVNAKSKTCQKFKAAFG